MKNIKVAKKLLLGFTLITFLAFAVGIIGIIGMTSVREGNQALYEKQAAPLADLARIMDYTQRSRISLRDIALHTGELDNLASMEQKLNEELTEIEALMDSYAQSPQQQDIKVLFDEARNLYNTVFLPVVPQVTAGAKQGQPQAELLELISGGTEGVRKMVDNLNQSLTIKIQETKESVDLNGEMSRTMLVIMIVVMALSLVLSLILALYISKLITEPIDALQVFFTKFVTTGNMELSERDRKNIESRGKDEIGTCIGAALEFVKRLMEFNECLSRIADGDLTAEIRVLSDKDSLGKAMDSVSANLNGMFHEIRMAADQVSMGAGQISQASQSLASGAAEQAASVEQFSASIASLQEKTKDNAENSRKAKQTNREAGEQLEVSMASMEKMLEAMIAIDESASKITKVITVIDDIAFQTNILALNAAVEAARAGLHGKGFAVVAEEVRSLASKSAAAAKETAGLIEESSQKVNEGRKIVEKTNQDMAVVIQHAQEAVSLVDQVAIASTEQAEAIEEMSLNMQQISEVVQANSSMSEESAASAQEMSAQAETVNDILSKFTLRTTEQGGRYTMNPMPAEERLPMETDVPALPMGKY